MDELNENIKIHELKTICRCCLSSNNKPLISFDKHTKEMFNFCVGLQIADDDGFPSKICCRCSKNLSMCYSFRQKCLKASEILSTVVPLQFEPECRLDMMHSNSFDDNIKDEASTATRHKSHGKTKSALLNSKSDTSASHHYDSSSSNDREKPLKKVSTIKPTKEKVCPVCGELKKHLKVHMRIHKDEYEYQCDSCGKQFHQRSSLLTHLQTHNTDRPFKCTLCDCTFKKAAYLRRHRNKHTNARPYDCPSCPKRFKTRYNREMHIRTHSISRDFECHYCNHRFKTKNMLAQHIKKHTLELAYTCFFCDMTFVHAQVASNHRRKFHRNSDNNEYKCPNDSCAYSSANIKQLELHWINEHPELGIRPNAGRPQENLLKDIRRVTETGQSLYECFFCDRTFTRSTAASVHRRVHMIGDVFQCPACSFGAPTSKDFKLHWRRNHLNLGERPSAEQMQVPRQMNRHYDCFFCDKTFLHSIQATAHRKTHRTGDEWICPACGHRSATTAALKLHWRRNHPESGDKPAPTSVVAMDIG